MLYVRPTAVLTLVCVGLAPLNGARADDVAPLLKTISDVGPEGRGQREAAQAWQKLARADAAALPRILAALDQANPLAANWLRSAAETIADRQTTRGKKLPARELETFLRDLRHAPRGRRLAFEILWRADPTAADRLLPTMLDDPSAELRRDAVARLVDEAGRLQAADASDRARAIYLRALTAARDHDQTEAIAAALEKLGHHVDLAEHFGFIMDWRLIGPFENTGKRGFDVAYPPETEFDPDARYAGKSDQVTWTTHVTDDSHGIVNLATALGPHKGAAAYALTDFSTGAARTVELRMATSNAWKMWVNGQLVSAHHKYDHRGMEPDRDAVKTFLKPQLDKFRMRVSLKAGRNRILIKLCQNEQTEDWAQLWQFQLRVCDPTGAAVLSTTRPAHNEKSRAQTN